MINRPHHACAIPGKFQQLAAIAMVLSVVFGGASLSTQPAQAQTFSVLYSFTGGADGEFVNGGLIRDAAGNLYGTTPMGGGSGHGVVFKLDTSGQQTVLYTFTGASDGSAPNGSLVRDAADNLYGTTSAGGVNANGVLFKLDPTGKEVRYSFHGTPRDGLTPQAGLIRDSMGNLYGTTQYGGSSNNGTVFKLDTSGKESLLYSFANSPNDGAYPTSPLTRDSVGNLYGTTPYGGALGCSFGTTCGVVFKLDTGGNETVLFRFTGGADGGEPHAALLRDTAGNLYGTTSLGGIGACAYGCGTVFKLDANNNFTLLYSFTGGSDGGNPESGLIRDAAGNLYGTAASGGVSGCLGYGFCGTLFKLDTSNNLTVLHTFTGGKDGGNPTGNLIPDTAGNLYGTATYGGVAGCGFGSGCGVVFKLSH